MKKLLLLVGLLCIPSVAWGGGSIGTFFTKVNAYVFADGPQQGKRVLLRSRNAVTVIGFVTDAQERIWYKVQVPGFTQKRSGEGWTPLSPAETLTAGAEGVPVYASTFEGKSPSSEMVQVPARDLELLNTTQNSKKFPQIIWQKVRYTMDEPMESWIRASTGIFRAGREQGDIQAVYEEMVSRNTEKEKLFRLLGGVVRVGDSAQEVQWAMGKPLRIQEESSGDTSQVTWHFTNLAIRIRNNVVERIN